MATSEQLIPIPGRLHSLAPEGHVAGADEIYDDDLQKSQSDINADVKVMGASGENHSKGLVPDPGATQGTSKYLREDGTWAQPDGQNYTAGDGIDITNNAISVKVGTNLSIDSSGNLNATDTTYSTMGASGSTHASGLVPDTPSTAGTTKFLREDGTWQEVNASPEVQIGGTAPTSESDIKLFVDESADDTVEVYTKTQVDSQFMVIVNSNSAPTSSTLTYTATDGTTKSFKTGDEIRVPDQDAENGYTFYKLYALTTESNVTTAVWDKVGAGGGTIVWPEFVTISLTQQGGSDSDLIGATIVVTDDDTSETILTTTWQGDTIVAQVDGGVDYTVTVGSVSTLAIRQNTQSYTAITGLTRIVKFEYYGDFVDMGLPSGLLWSRTNIDASQPSGLAKSEYQYECSFFSWGNIIPHNPISSSAFDYNFGSNNSGPYASTPGATLTGNVPTNATYDIARAICGNPCRLPTSSEFQELLENCNYVQEDGATVITEDNKIITIKGIKGLYLRSKINGNLLFFPMCGYATGTTWNMRSGTGCYWSSTMASSTNGLHLNFPSGGIKPQYSSAKFNGLVGRAVM